MKTPASLPSHEEVAAELRQLRERGVARAREVETPALLDCAARAGNGTSVERLLTSAVNAMSAGEIRMAAGALFGLSPGSHGRRPSELREDAALIRGVAKETFRKTHEPVVLDNLAASILHISKNEVDNAPSESNTARLPAIATSFANGEPGDLDHPARRFRPSSATFFDTGSGCIDLAVDHAGQLLYSADASGQISCFDLKTGFRCWSRVVSMPAWGIALSDDKSQLATAHADKQSNRGEFVSLRATDGAILWRGKTEAPAWDVLFRKGSGDFVVSTWGKGLYLCDSDARTSSPLPIPGDLFGLAVVDSGHILMVVGAQGIVELDLAAETPQWWIRHESMTASYNLNVSSEGAVLIGSSSNTALLAGVSHQEMILHTSMNAVSAVSMTSDLLILCGLDGTIEVWRTQSEIHTLLTTIDVGAAVWHLSLDGDDIYLGLGTGQVCRTSLAELLNG